MLMPEEILERIRVNDPTLTKYKSPHPLTDGDVRILCDAMTSNPFLTELDLSAGQIPAVDYSDPSRVSENGAVLLANCRFLKVLDISGNPIHDEGAIALARSRSITHLTVNRCAIGRDGMYAFLGNRVLVEFWGGANVHQNDSDWGRQIDQMLKRNAAIPIVPDYFSMALSAISQRNFLDFKTAVLQLPNGPDTEENPSSHETLLMRAAAFNLERYAKYLLDCGAKLEKRNHQDYTSFFIATEEGSLDVFKLFLHRSGNLTGEFDQEIQEDILSIAGFKLNDQLCEYLQCHQLPETVRRDCEAYQLNLDRFQFSGMGWKDFGCKPKEEVKLLSDQAIQLIQKLKDADCDISKLDERMLIFKLAYDKYAVISRKSLSWPNEYFESLLPPGEARLQLDVFRGTQHLNTPVDLSDAIARLNNELQNGRTEADINWSGYPKLLIAQYRGIHYYQHYFSEDQRRDHIGTVHLNRQASAPAIYSMSSLALGQQQLLKESRAEVGRVQLSNFFEEAKHRSFTNPHFINKADELQELMSNNYAAHLEAVRQGKEAPYDILSDMGALQYPHYATSDLPEHALKYGYAHGKPVKPLMDHRLLANYDHDGKPENKILGKIFICLLTPQAMHDHAVVHVAGLHNRRRINFKFAGERETSFPGGIKSNYVFYEAPLEVPDFSADQKDVEKYGLDFDLWRRRFSQASSDADRRKLEDELMSFMVIGMTQKLFEIARKEAERQGGHLIYRCFDQAYALGPEEIRQEVAYLPAKKSRKF